MSNPGAESGRSDVDNIQPVQPIPEDRKIPDIDIKVDLDLLNQAARHRVEKVVKEALDEELAKSTNPVLENVPEKEIITIGELAQDQ